MVAVVSVATVVSPRRPRGVATLDVAPRPCRGVATPLGEGLVALDVSLAPHAVAMPLVHEAPAGAALLAVAVGEVAGGVTVSVATVKSTPISPPRLVGGAVA